MFCVYVFTDIIQQHSGRKKLDLKFSLLLLCFTRTYAITYDNNNDCTSPLFSFTSSPQYSVAFVGTASYHSKREFLNRLHFKRTLSGPLEDSLTSRATTVSISVSCSQRWFKVLHARRTVPFDIEWRTKGNLSPFSSSHAVPSDPTSARGHEARARTERRWGENKQPEQMAGDGGRRGGEERTNE